MLNKTLPMELSQFKNLGPNTPMTQVNIPETAENRTKTDRPFLIAFGVSVIFLMPFMIHTLIYSDVRRLTEKIDDCGNICGVQNEKYDKWNCTGQDFTHKKFLKIDKKYGDVQEAKSPFDEDTDLIERRYDEDIETNFKLIRQCVDDCSFGRGTRDPSGKCIVNVPEDYNEEMDIGSYLLNGSIIFRLMVCSLIAVGVSILVLYIFRFAVGCVVWTIIVSVFILSVIIVGLMWGDYADGNSGLAACIICTSLLPCYVGIMYYLRERIALVIVIITESTKAVFAMPSLVIVPISIFFIEAVIITISFTTIIYMVTAGDLVEKSPGYLEYEMTGVMTLTIFLYIVMTLWVLFILCGLQYMIVGGAVSEWYFIRDKTQLSQPVRKSVNIAYKFHLGTIIFGSLVILLAEIFRVMVNALIKNKLIRRCMDIFLSAMDAILQLITNRAYIVTAMHGQPFLKSGKRAVSLIVYNLGKMIAIRLIGRLTMAVGAILIGIISALVSMLFFLGESDEANRAIVIWIVFVMSLFVGSTFFSVLGITMDTIFLCYCEDCLLNDGMARPYAMSQELMEFIDNSKKVYGVYQEPMQFEGQTPQPV